MNITKEEQIKILIERISEEVSAGGGSASYRRVSLRRLAEVLLELIDKKEKTPKKSK